MGTLARGTSEANTYNMYIHGNATYQPNRTELSPWHQWLPIAQRNGPSHVRLAVYSGVSIPYIHGFEYFKFTLVCVFGYYVRVVHHIGSR